jgi:cytochrome b561
MSYRNTATRYGSVAKIFHWTIFVLVLGMIVVGFGFEAVPKEIGYPLITLHKSTGLVVLAIMTLRILWTLSKLVHWSLYGLLFTMPISGWVMATAADKAPLLYGLFTVPMPGVPIDKPLSKLAEHWHGYMGWAISILIILHILSALKHHFIDKDNILKRMMPGN